MSRFSERIRNHEVHARLEELTGRVDDLEESLWELLDGQTGEVIDRIASVVRYISGVLASVDPELVPEDSLSGLDSHAAQVMDLLVRLEAEPQVTSEIDVALDSMMQSALPLAMASPAIADRTELAGDAFGTALQGAVRDVEESVAAQGESLDALEARLTSAAHSAEEEISSRTESIRASVDALETRINSESQRLDGLVPTFESQFREDQESRRAEFDQLKTNLHNETASTLDAFREQAKETSETVEGETDEVLSRIHGREAEVENLYNVIFTTGTAGEFSKEADAQQEQADRWRSLTMVFGSAAALVAVSSIVLAVLGAGNVSSVGTIVAKVTATVATAGIAAYAGRQSGLHRSREVEARSLQLDLVALEPFLEKLDEKSQFNIRTSYAARAFSGRQQGGEPETNFFGLSHKNEGTGWVSPEQLREIVAAVTSRSQGT